MDLTVWRFFNYLTNLKDKEMTKRESMRSFFNHLNNVFEENAIITAQFVVQKC